MKRALTLSLALAISGLAGCGSAQHAVPSRAAGQSAAQTAARNTTQQFYDDLATYNLASDCRLISPAAANSLIEESTSQPCSQAMLSLVEQGFTGKGLASVAQQRATAAKDNAYIARASVTAAGAHATVTVPFPTGTVIVTLAADHGGWLITNFSSSSQQDSSGAPSEPSLSAQGSQLEEQETVAWNAEKEVTTKNPNQSYDTGKRLVSDIVGSEPELSSVVNAASDPGGAHAKPGVMYLGATTASTFIAVAYTSAGRRVLLSSVTGTFTVTDAGL